MCTFCSVIDHYSTWMIFGVQLAFPVYLFFVSNETDNKRVLYKIQGTPPGVILNRICIFIHYVDLWCWCFISFT